MPNLTGIPSPQTPFVDPKTGLVSREWYRFLSKVIPSDNGGTFAGPVTFQQGATGVPPTGACLPYSGTTAPSGYLMCDGSAVSRTTYAALFAVSGTAFGAGDGSTTFNVPDLRGRAPIGAGTGTASDATNHALGASQGNETHILSLGEMPGHNHGGATGSTSPPQIFGNNTAQAGANPGGIINAGYSNTAGSLSGSNFNNAHTHVIGVDGSNLPHTNMPPTLALNFIIKT